MKCEFCEDYAFLKKRGKDDKGEQCLTIGLREAYYHNGRPASACTHIGYKLNYCPECGKKLEKGL